MSGPHAVLDGCGSGDEAPRFPTLLQPCFILPHQAMCLKTRELVAENVVLRVGNFGPARERRARPPLELRAPDDEIPTGHQARDERLRFRIARRPTGAFSD